MKTLKVKLFILIVIILSGPKYTISAQEADGYYNESKAHILNKAYSDAMGAINMAIAIDTSNANYYMQRANIFYCMGEYNSAIDDCYKSLKIEPNKPEIYLLRGLVCLVTESYGGAILFFGKAIKFTTDQNILFEGYFNRGKAYFKMKKLQEALVDLQSASEIKNSTPELIFLMANTYLEMNNNDEAVDILNKLIELEPDYAQAYELRGNMAMKNKEYEKAIEAYNHYCNMDLNNANVYIKLSEAYLATAKYSEAMQSLNKSIALNSNNVMVNKIKGLLYIAQGLKEQGCDFLFKAMQQGYLENYGYDLLETYLKNCEAEE